jgi:hypothetical protein
MRKRTSQESKTTKSVGVVTKPTVARNGGGRNGDLLKEMDKANAHLMKALEMIRKSRARTANKTSQKWRKSLMTRTS